MSLLKKLAFGAATAYAVYKASAGKPVSSETTGALKPPRADAKTPSKTPAKRRRTRKKPSSKIAKTG